MAEAVNPGGAIVVYGTTIDKERREVELLLLMCLNMLIETPAGFDYTAGECIERLHDAVSRMLKPDPFQAQIRWYRH